MASGQDSAEEDPGWGDELGGEDAGQVSGSAAGTALPPSGDKAGAQETSTATTASADGDAGRKRKALTEAQRAKRMRKHRKARDRKVQQQKEAKKKMMLVRPAERQQQAEQQAKQQGPGGKLGGGEVAAGAAANPAAQSSLAAALAALASSRSHVDATLAEAGEGAASAALAQQLVDREARDERQRRNAFFDQHRHVPPDDYVCNVCQKPGHWLKNCPVHKAIASEQAQKRAERAAAAAADASRQPSAKRPVCKYFACGKCTRGAECAFRHEGTPQAETRPPCTFLMRGGCSKGKDCAFSHELGETACLYFHLGSRGCRDGDRCAYSHAALDADGMQRLRARQAAQQAAHRSKQTEGQ